MNVPWAEEKMNLTKNRESVKNISTDEIFINDIKIPLTEQLHGAIALQSFVHSELQK